MTHHRHSIDHLALHLRTDLLAHGRTGEALELIDRVLQHPRVARALFAHPFCGRVPLVLARHAGELGQDRVRAVIEALQPLMPAYGRYQCEFALSLLGDATARQRAVTILHRPHREGSGARPASCVRFPAGEPPL